MTSLVNNLGGTAGFGEFWLPANDDGSTAFIDLTPIFGTQGINFFGRYYTGFYLNNNGSVTFNAASSSFTPSAITGSTSNPVIAAYWADIDTRGGGVTPTPGGTSAGTNLLWYDLDSVTHTFTATWDDVGYYSGQTNKLNAFQLSIHQVNAQGDFDITFRYENVDWTTGNASGGSNGLGGTPARAGYSAGNGVEYFELPQSGNQADLLALESASNIGTPGTFVFSVRNGVPSVGVTVGDASAVEDDGDDPRYVSIPVFLTEPSSSTLTVHYTTANGTALAGQDYVAQSGILTFAPGVTQQNILVDIAGDAIVEGDETFTVTLSDPSDGASILDGSATGTIVDDDASLSIAAANADAAEGNAGTTALTFTVTRIGETSRPATANWTVSGPAVDGADFAGGTLPSGTVTLGIGETSRTITLHVAGDTQFESDESFTVTLSDPGPGTSLGTASAMGVIRNDDSAPASLSIAATSADKPEGQAGSTPFTFTVTRTGDRSGAASAHWAVAGAAVTGADFTGGTLPSGTVIFAAEETSKIISINVAGDTVVEANEAFSVVLSSPSAGVILDTASASGIIHNDDSSLSIVATHADRSEGDTGTTPFTFTVTRSGDLDGTASVHWAVDGSAVDATDFADGVLPSGTVSFAAGETSKIISIDVAGDSVVEANEAFSVVLSNPSVGAILGTASASGIIHNDDSSLSIVATHADRSEGDTGTTPFTFTVTRSGDLDGTASVHWAVDGSAVDATDFADGVLPSGTVSFAAGETSKIISIDVAGDSVVEANEDFSVVLSSPSADTSLGIASASGIIRNDDVSLSISAISADKFEEDLGATSFTFAVTRSGDLSGATSVDWAVSGTDVNDSDFIPFDELLGSAGLMSVTASIIGSFFRQIPSEADASSPPFSLYGGVLPSGQVSFAAGESCKAVTVWVLGETLEEQDESFLVTLSHASEGAVIDTASAAGTIRNDDTTYVVDCFVNPLMGADLLGWS